MELKYRPMEGYARVMQAIRCSLYALYNSVYLITELDNGVLLSGQPDV